MICHSLCQWTTFYQALTCRDMPFSHLMSLDDMPCALVVPLLVLVEHVNIHQLLGVSQHAAWGPEQRPMKKAKIRDTRR